MKTPTFSGGIWRASSLLAEMEGKAGSKKKSFWEVEAETTDFLRS